ncbi:hypothetical protein DUNSADRAFT_10986 [Dunaliella salina]|uniref:Encoded protein n=1 Tax=Dunaliella salina TaxID=3046 RepID=A0ABQ7GEA6_DUNSA|nr:hypothetical protein DUNSADRAFT_10986 [Dunaliella salina]|eukprot:KAF5832940.1 hypothetical protein DUNSADRAFT_10986 [Dunaliella salina]
MEEAAVSPLHGSVQVCVKEKVAIWMESGFWSCTPAVPEFRRVGDVKVISDKLVIASCCWYWSCKSEEGGISAGRQDGGQGIGSAECRKSTSAWSTETLGVEFVELFCT